MRPRVEIAIDRLAAAFVTVAVFGLPLWVVALTVGDQVGWYLVAFALGLALAWRALLRLVASGHLLSSIHRSVVVLVGCALLTWIVAVIAFFVAYAIEINASLCGGGTAATVAWIGGVTIFTAVGTWALTSPRFALLWAMSLAPVVAFAWSLLSLAVIPGGHGYCET